MKTEIRIRGLNEINTALRQLPGRMDKKLLDRGLIEGAKLIRDDARARVPLLQHPDPRRLRGTIQKAIRAGRVRPEGRYRATVWVRVRPLTRRQMARFKKKRGSGGQNNPRDPYYWAWVEFGTSKMSARPFMRPAFESKKLEAVHTAVDTLRPLVEAEIAKLGAFSRSLNYARRK